MLGSFQLNIPVETREVLLGPEERLLSVLRWIAKGMPNHNRWHPVFRRYLEQIAGRVSALGGNPSKILPSPSGDGGAQPQPTHKRPEDRLHFTGKIAGLVFDRYGDFAGFLLDTEDGEREFSSREKEIAELAQRPGKSGCASPYARNATNHTARSLSSYASHQHPSGPNCKRGENSSGRARLEI